MYVLALPDCTWLCAPLAGDVQLPGQQFVQLAACLLWLRGQALDAVSACAGPLTPASAPAQELSSTQHAWQRYISGVMPAEPQLTCLLNFKPEEAAHLQFPELIVGVNLKSLAVQRARVSQIPNGYLTINTVAVISRTVHCTGNRQVSKCVVAAASE